MNLSKGWGNMTKLALKKLLAIDDFEEFMRALVETFPEKSLIPASIGDELYEHLRMLARKVNSETIENHTDPRRKYGTARVT
jgi:hypothetical protein